MQLYSDIEEEFKRYSAKIQKTGTRAKRAHEKVLRAPQLLRRQDVTVSGHRAAETDHLIFCNTQENPLP